MRTRGAVITETPGKWQIVDIDFDEPRQGEVMLEMVAAGLCHSDDHFATGDITVGHLPICGGHEAAGVVEAVGPGVSTLSVGDHVVTAFIPSCAMSLELLTSSTSVPPSTRMMTPLPRSTSARPPSGA